MRITAAFVMGAALICSAFAEPTTSQSTLTITKTVERVVQTVTASSSTAKIYWPQTAGWNGKPAVGTAASTGTGVGSYTSSTGPPIVSATGAASSHGIDSVGLAAIAGIVGILAI